MCVGLVSINTSNVGEIEKWEMPEVIFPEDNPYSDASVILGEAFFSGKLTRIYYLTPKDIQQTWQTFEKFSDKNWSFTDCSSKWIIEKLKIKTALTLDHHFQQFGSVLVLP